MKKIISIFLLCCISFGLQAQNPNKLFKQEKYPEAFLSYVKAIEAKPRKKGPQKAFAKSYNELISSLNSQQENLVRNTQTFTGDQTVSDMLNLLNGYRKVQEGLDILNFLEIKEVAISKKEVVSIDIPSQEPKIKAAEILLAQLKEQAAEMHYAKGLKNLETEDRPHQKAAAREFKKAMYYVQDYKDSKEKYTISREAATLRIIILPYYNRTGRTGLGAIGNRFSSTLVSRLSKDKSVMEFLEIVTETDLRNAMQSGTQSFGYEVTNSTAEELRTKMNADEVFTGSLNQVITPKPEVVNSDLLEYEAEIDTGKRIKKFNEKKNKEVEEIVYEKRKAFYRSHTATHMLTLVGTHNQISDEGVKTINFEEKNSVSVSWTTYHSGERKVYAKISSKAEAVPAEGSRIGKLIDQLAEKQYQRIRSRILHQEIPVITKLQN